MGTQGEDMENGNVEEKMAMSVRNVEAVGEESDVRVL